MSAAVAAASAAAMSQYTSRSSNSGGVSGPVISYNNVQNTMLRANSVMPVMSRYESQKRRDWNTLGEYLRNHRPPLALARCSGAHVLEFLRYLDQFGKTKVHGDSCPYFGVVHPAGPCACPLRQAWGSLDALVGRLRAAFEEHGGEPETNPFAARAVRLYLREVRDSQAKARGIAYDKKRKAKTTTTTNSNNNQLEQIGNVNVNVINRGRERERERGRGATHCMLRACFRS